MGTMFLLNALSIFFTSDITLRQYLSQFLETVPNKPPMLNLELFLSIMKGVAYFMFFVSIILLSHILLNFRIMKKYHYLFGGTIYLHPIPVYNCNKMVKLVMRTKLCSFPNLSFLLLAITH